jgi:hypothetical protein
MAKSNLAKAGKNPSLPGVGLMRSTKKVGMTPRQGNVQANKGRAGVANGSPHSGQPKLKPPAPTTGRGSGRASSGREASPNAGASGDQVPVKKNVAPRGPAMSSPKTLIVRGGPGKSTQGAGEAKANAGWSKHTRKPG